MRLPSKLIFKSSMQVNRRLQLAGFFLSLAEWDRHVEVIRQVLNSLDRFEPYAAFLRISKGRSNIISVANLSRFLEENGIKVEEKLLSMIIRLYDTNFEGCLNFEDFLKMILTRDNPDMRFESALRPNYDVVGFENVLGVEIEYTLARFFKKASEFLQKMIQDPETQLLINDNTIFTEVDARRTKRIDFNNLKAFFETSKIVPRDSEIISVLRVIDINDDGVITELEFNYFIDLFSHAVPSASLVAKLRELKRQEMGKSHHSELPTRDANNGKEEFRRVAQFTSYTPNRTESSKTPPRAERDGSFARTQPLDFKRQPEQAYTSLRNDEASQHRSNHRVEEPNFHSRASRTYTFDPRDTPSETRERAKVESESKTDKSPGEADATVYESRSGLRRQTESFVRNERYTILIQDQSGREAREQCHSLSG